MNILFDNLYLKPKKINHKNIYKNNLSYKNTFKL